MTKTLLQSPAILMLTTAAVVFGTAAYAQTQPAKPAKPAAAKPAHAAVKKPAKPDPTEQAVLLGRIGLGRLLHRCMRRFRRRRFGGLCGLSLRVGGRAKNNGCRGQH